MQPFTTRAGHSLVERRRIQPSRPGFEWADIGRTKSPNFASHNVCNLRFTKVYIFSNPNCHTKAARNSNGHQIQSIQSHLKLKSLLNAFRPDGLSVGWLIDQTFSAKIRLRTSKIDDRVYFLSYFWTNGPRAWHLKVSKQCLAIRTIERLNVSAIEWCRSLCGSAQILSLNVSELGESLEVLSKPRVETRLNLRIDHQYDRLNLTLYPKVLQLQI